MEQSYDMYDPNVYGYNNMECDNNNNDNTQTLIIAAIAIGGLYYYITVVKGTQDKPKVELLKWCSDDTITYTKVEGTDYPRQGDLMFKRGILKDCKEECDKMDTCHGFVHRDDQVCWLKDNSVTTPVYNYRANYYYKPELDKLPDAKAPKGSVYSNTYVTLENVNFPDPMGEMYFARGNIKGCEERCNAYPHCHGYIRRESDQSCWLKDNSIIATEGVNDSDYSYFYKAGGKKPTLPKS